MQTRTQEPLAASARVVGWVKRDNFGCGAVLWQVWVWVRMGGGDDVEAALSSRGARAY